MIKVEVTEEFTYGEFDKIKSSLVRKGKDKEGWLYVGDTFECDEPTLKYLTGDNKLNKVVVKLIEVIPEKTPIEVTATFSEKGKPALKVTKKGKKKTSKK